MLIYYISEKLLKAFVILLNYFLTITKCENKQTQTDFSERALLLKKSKMNKIISYGYRSVEPFLIIISKSNSNDTYLSLIYQNSHLTAFKLLNYGKCNML